MWAFIPGTEPKTDKSFTSGGEGVWADDHGMVYAAEVGQMAVVRYVKAAKP